MNALKSMGMKLVTPLAVAGLIATGLVAGGAFAAGSPTVTVTLPEAVNVGSSTLVSGQYTISESFISGGVSMFVFRSDKGETTSAVALKIAEPSNEQKTAVVLSNEGGALHLDKLFIAGASAGYQFSQSGDVK